MSALLCALALGLAGCSSAAGDPERRLGPMPAAGSEDPCAAVADCFTRCVCSDIEASLCQDVCDESPEPNGVGGAPAGGTGGAAASGGAASGTGGDPSTGGDAGTGGAPGAGGDPGTGGDVGMGGTGGGVGTGGGGTVPMNLPNLGTLVVLGDSIGDGGGVGPYYYDRLRDSLSARYGAIQYVHRAESGSETRALPGQVQSLPAALPGPVAVAITSGGNDIKEDVVEVALGQDALRIAGMRGNIARALDTLQAPGRFGPGVEVFVFQANIYDPTDGQGNFNSFNCNVSTPVVLPTDDIFLRWNGAIEEEISNHGATLIDLHGVFRLHGMNYPPTWFHSDCTHPNPVGHDQLHRNVYWLITGEQLP